MENVKETKERRNGKVKFFLSAIVLVLIFVMLFHYVSLIFVHPTEDKSYHVLQGIYAEEENTLDAVFLGASTTYTIWDAMIGWESFGITGYSYATPQQPFAAQLGLCKEARKTQPDAVYVFNLTPLTEYYDGEEVLSFHWVIDFMPFSLNKLELTKNLMEASDFTPEEQLEFYIPLIRYHSSWNDLKDKNFVMERNNYKGSPIHKKFIKNRRDMSADYKTYSGYYTFSDEEDYIVEDIQDILNYIQKEHVKAIFIVSPIIGRDEMYYELINTAKQMVEEVGLPVLDLHDPENIEAMRLDLTEDYYNGSHLNVHGCLKSTKFLAEYLMEHFDIQDKREDASYAPGKDWTEAAKQYRKEYIRNFALDPEYAYQIDYDSETVKLYYEGLGEGKARLYWKATEGADSYVVYKRTSPLSPWKELATLSGDTTEMLDTNTPGQDVYYTMIAKVGDHWTNYYERGRYVVAE